MFYYYFEIIGAKMILEDREKYLIILVGIVGKKWS